MALPHSTSRLAGITDFGTWRAAVERALADLDSRIASARPSSGARSSARMATVEAAPVTSTRAGEAYVWVGQGLPYDAVPADGAVVAVADYPYLHAALADLYATGDEPANHFRLPDLGASAAGVWVVRT